MRHNSFAFMPGNSADAVLTAIFCLVLGVVIWTCGAALRELLANRG
jgi:hypothetical protein